MGDPVERPQALALRGVYAAQESGGVQVIETLHDIADQWDGDCAGFLVLIWHSGGISIMGSGTASGNLHELLADAQQALRTAEGAPEGLQ